MPQILWYPNKNAFLAGNVHIGHVDSVGDYSTALGYGAITGGQYATALGYNVQANGAKAISIGSYYDYTYFRLVWDPITKKFTITPVHVTKNNIANGDYSIAIGNGGSGSRSDAMVVLKNGNTTINGILTTNGFNASTINPGNNANLTIDAGTLYIDATNNRVGINNTAPSYSLDVTGTMKVSGTGGFGGDVSLSSASPAFYMYDTDSSADDFRFEANNDALSIWSQGKLSYLLFNVSSAGIVRMPYVYGNIVGTTYRDLYIDNAGNLGYLSSSSRYKTDIENIDNISWLYDLRPVTFQYKNSLAGEKQYGLIAEEVLKINHDFVSFNSTGEPETVTYSALITPLLKAVQDQKKTIETLKADNDALKLRLEKLEAMVSALSDNQK